MISLSLCSLTSTPAWRSPVVRSSASDKICARSATELMVLMAGSSLFFTKGGRKRTSPPSGRKSASSNRVWMISWYACAVVASDLARASSCAVLCSRSVMVSRNCCCTLYLALPSFFQKLRTLRPTLRNQLRVSTSCSLLFIRRIACATDSYRAFSFASVGYRDFAPGRRERISSRYCSIVKYRQSCPPRR